MANVAAIVSGAAPAAIVPSVQGNAVHGPLADTKLRPVGVGLERVTSRASDGPAFVTAIAYAIDVPAVAVAGPLTLTWTSAEGVNGARLIAELLARMGSVVPGGTEAVAVLVSV